jgi:hypothetical protein
MAVAHGIKRFHGNRHTLERNSELRFDKIGGMHKNMLENQSFAVKIGGRALKRKVLELLKSVNFEQALRELCRLPARRVVNPLFSFLYHSDEEIKRRAVTAMGAVTAELASRDPESARVIIRRLMWNLNDESGGIGWGSAEALGEILASSETLAEEYSRILISYARPDGNYQEHKLMQRGILWGIERLSQVRPELVKDVAPYIKPYLKSQDACLRELAAGIIEHLQSRF